MPTFAGLCPICGHRVQDNERFVLQWYEPRKWWVARHLVPDPEGTSSEPFVIANERFKVHCGRAGYNPETGLFSFSR